MCKSLKFKIVREKRGVIFISKHVDEHKMDQIPQYLYPESEKCESNSRNLYLI